MHVLILGATGPSGVLFIREALAHSHAVTIYARSPHKLPEDLAINAHVTVHKGELDEEAALSDAMDGVDAVLSALGPNASFTTSYPTDRPFGRAYSLILRVMKEKNVHRLIALGTPSITDEEDRASLRFALATRLLRYVLNAVYEDVRAIGRTLRTEGTALDIQWTIARVPMLTNATETRWHAGYVGDGKSAFTLSRAAFAAFVIHELEHNEWVGKAPAITDG
ncbi:NAD(P)-binding protein [Coniophora puteana RWD-64-598 SS2]|uniref:NAD(P)-binding protein n=1 Tax=Coniophora puteana (strain RWD-64-598) TaxID=741705 RepID=A0A5M3ME93_CONPW|nr:NAD(P)-binding protein [Coniophora puteana RWD-64-598 SS2]EIW77326.1 NAD(P)-binding protein [Coniophora puteana RWD-64-598 SS2]